MARARSEGDGAAAAPGPLDAALVRRLDRRLHEEQAAKLLPVLAAGLSRDGALVWSDSAGTTGLPEDGVDVMSVQFRIGSISKTFVAVSVLRLRDEGALDISDPIGAHLPELSELPITIAQLLSHTSGLRAETPAPWWERVPGSDFATLASVALGRVDLLCRPGRRFHYSNLGYAVLGEVVARRRGAPVWDVVREELLVPLAMERTSPRPVPPHAAGFAVHPHAALVHAEPAYDGGAMGAAGQLWSTIEELARWSAVLAGQRPDVLSPPTAAEMAEPIGIVDLPGQPWAQAYGLGLQLSNRNGHRRFGHAGAMPGYWAMVLVDQASKDAVVAVANSTYRGQTAQFFHDLLDLLASGAPAEVAPFVAHAAADREVLALLGTWYWGPVEHRLHLGDGRRLELRGIAPGRDCDFLPAGDGTYVGQFGYFNGERLVVHRRPDGSVSHLDIASFVLTRSPYDPAAAVPGGLDPAGWHAVEAGRPPVPQGGTPVSATGGSGTSGS